MFEIVVFFHDKAIDKHGSTHLEHALMKFILQTDVFISNMNKRAKYILNFLGVSFFSMPKSNNEQCHMFLDFLKLELFLEH